MGTLPVVLLATCSALPDGEEWTGTTHLTDAFTARGIDARWVVWDDPDVDWSEGLVAVRSTWDYETRLEEFLAWARSVPRMLNSAEVFAWNTDKAYLTELAATGVPVVPTLVVEGEEELPAAIAEVSDAARVSAVVKPRVGAGGRGVVVFDWTDGGPADLDESDPRARPLGGAAAGGVRADRGGDLRVRPRRPGGLAGAEAPGRG